MSLSIKDPEAERLARAVARHTGETMTKAVITALRERLIREERRVQDQESLIEDLLEIGRHCSQLPTLDTRSDDDILGYDQHGIPHT